MLLTPSSLIWVWVANNQGTAQTLAAKPGANGHNFPFLFLFYMLFYSLPLSLS